MRLRASFVFIGFLFAIGALLLGIFGSVAAAYMGAALLAAIQAPAREGQPGMSPARRLAFVLMALAILLAIGHLWIGVPITDVPGRSISMGWLIFGATFLAPAYTLAFKLAIAKWAAF
jgi:hypothetical protein